MIELIDCHLGPCDLGALGSKRYWEDDKGEG